MTFLCLEKGFTQFFSSLPKEPALIRFFDRKELYYVHGDDALFVAKEFFNSLAGLKYFGSSSSGSTGFGFQAKKQKTLGSGQNSIVGSTNTSSSSNSSSGLPYLYIREGMEFSSVLRLLLFKKNYRVEIWKNQDRTSDWFLHKKGSPGNLEDLEDWLGQVEEAHRLPVKSMAIQIGTADGHQVCLLSFRTGLLITY